MLSLELVLTSDLADDGASGVGAGTGAGVGFLWVIIIIGGGCGAVVLALILLLIRGGGGGGAVFLTVLFVGIDFRFVVMTGCIRTPL